MPHGAFRPWHGSKPTNTTRRGLLSYWALPKAGGVLWGGPTVSFPDMLVYQEECERRTRRALGEREFKKNFNHGNALIYEDAVAYALGKKPRAAQAQSSDTANLTRRERQVADLVADGLTNKAIAERLVISDRTAQGHVEHILSKLGFTSRTQVAAWVVEQTQNPTT